jgi:hypothetical protein
MGMASVAFWADVTWRQWSRVSTSYLQMMNFIKGAEQIEKSDVHSSVAIEELFLRFELGMRQDAALLVMAAHLSLKLAEATLEARSSPGLAEAVGAFKETNPGLVDLRDMLNHLDEYVEFGGRRGAAIGDGSLGALVGDTLDDLQFALFDRAVGLRVAADGCVVLARAEPHPLGH